jgi:hypothetical protein
MKYYTFPALALVLLAADSALAAPAWTPSKLLAGQLSPAITLAGFTIQPPKGYSKSPAPTTKNDPLEIWASPFNATGHATILSFAQYTKPGAKARTQPLASTVARFVQAQASSYKGWKVTPTQMGTIHGAPFCRCYWSGIEIDRGVQREGFLYLGRSGTSIYALSAQVTGTKDRKALALAEASVLTFRQK